PGRDRGGFLQSVSDGRSAEINRRPVETCAIKGQELTLQKSATCHCVCLSTANRLTTNRRFSPARASFAKWRGFARSRGRELPHAEALPVSPLMEASMRSLRGLLPPLLLLFLLLKLRFGCLERWRWRNSSSHENCRIAFARDALPGRQHAVQADSE